MNIAQTSLRPLVIDNGDGTCTPLVSTASTVTVTAVQDYDVQAFFTGAPGANAIVLRHVAARAFILPAALTGSKLSAVTAATASTVFLVKLNGANVGTITVAIS